MKIIRRSCLFCAVAYALLPLAVIVFSAVSISAQEAGEEVEPLDPVPVDLVQPSTDAMESPDESGTLDEVPAEGIPEPVEEAPAPVAAKPEPVAEPAAVETVEAAVEPAFPAPAPAEPPPVVESAPAAPAPVVRNGKPKMLGECTDIPGLSRKINFDTDNMDVVKFITMLGDAAIGGDLNLVISAQVKGSVKLMIKDVTVCDALEIALAGNNLAYEIKGTGPRAIINIMTDQEYQVLKGVSFYEQRQVKIIELKYAKPSRLIAMLDGVRSQIGKLIYDDMSGTLVLIDTPMKIEEMQTVIAKTEIKTIERQIPTVTKTYRLQYADVGEIEKVVAARLTKEIGVMSANAKAKTVMVTDLEHNVAKIGELITAFDRKPKQVMIEAKVVEVELAHDFSMGVNWQHILQGIGPRFSLETKAPLSGPAGPSINYKTITAGGELSIVVDALKTVGNTTVISKPHIACRDGEEATLKVVRNQAYKEVTYESGSTNITQVSYKFIEIGTILQVKPTINDDGFVTVQIKPTMSDLVDWYDATKGNEGVVGVPIIKKAEAETSITVQDGVTIIIGGMIKDEKRSNRVGVPVISAIPILGRLFSSNIEKTQKIETIVFLTPKIVSGEEPFLRADKAGMAEGTGNGNGKSPIAKQLKPLRAK